MRKRKLRKRKQPSLKVEEEEAPKKKPRKKRKSPVYSKEGLESLRKHMREKVNTKQHYKTRNMDFAKDPNFRKMMSCLAREQHQIRKAKEKVNADEEEERVNDHCGVLTKEQLESLDG